MIQIDQALISAFIAGNFDLPIAHENEHYQPDGSAYAEIIVIQNDVTALNLKHHNETDGLLRVILRYPTDTGAIEPKQKADEIFAAFPIGQRLSYGGVTVTITGNARAPGVPEAGWYKLVLTLPYKAFLART
jgi:hypothetical protein